MRGHTLTAWRPGTVARVGDVAAFEGAPYLCLRLHRCGRAPDGAHWVRLPEAAGATDRERERENEP